MAKAEIKVGFKPDRPGNKLTSIKAFIFDTAFKGGRIVIGTGEKVNPSHWSKKRKRCNDVKGIDGNSIYENTNTQLDRFAAKAKEVFAELNEQGREIDNNEFRNLLQIKLKTARATIATNTLDLLGYIKDRIDNNYEVLINGEYKKLKPRTIANKKQILTKLKGYKNWNGNKRAEVQPVTFEAMNDAFYRSFLIYLTEELEHTANTRGKIIKSLKNFLNHAQADGYNVNPEYKKYVCEVGESKEVTYLNEDELLAIRALDLSKEEHLDRVRDLFVFAAYTGFRYSDVFGFQQHWIDDRNKVIKYKQQKTGQVVAVPYSLIVKEILKKYDYNLPRISNQKANKHIKEVCELAEIDNVVRYEIKIEKDGTSKRVKVLKWQTVTTHDARRSFCSNLYHKKVPSYNIMKLSGHKTEASFLRYIGIDGDVNAIEIGRTEYFNTTLTIAK